MTTSQDGLRDLFANSGLDDEAVDALNLTVDNLGDDIMAGLGDVDADAIDAMGATEVLLVKLLVDDSSSIEAKGHPDGTTNTDVVMEGVNRILDDLMASKAAGAILVSIEFLNAGVLCPFIALEQAVRLTRSNYRPVGVTPLYDRSAAVLANVVAKMSELEQGGVAVRCATYIISDGADVGSSKYRLPEAVAPIVGKMLLSEVHIIGAMGIADGFTDFMDIFTRMGLRTQFILTPGNTPSEVRRGFGTMSKSAVRASQTAGSFSQTAMGGFGDD